MRVAQRSYLALLPLVACGSGNLGTIVDGISVAKPEASFVTEASDAGQGRASVDQGSCGDGVIQTSRGEQCDGDQLGDRSCKSLGLGSGALSCDALSCQVVTSGCVPSVAGAGGTSGASSASTGRGGASADAGAAGAGAAAAAGAGGSSGTAVSCPTGYTCRPSITQATQMVCMAWGEDSAPLCFNGGSGGCASKLPGATCIDTNVGTYCVLPCAP